MKRITRFTLGLCLGLTAAALVASAAQATARPDDRAGMLGVDPQQIAASGATAVRPDDRAGPLGVAPQQLAADESDAISRYLGNHTTAVRPDDRAGPLGIGEPAPAASTSADPGFSWSAAGVGAGAVLGALLIALAGLGVSRRRRSAAAALQS